MSDDFIVFVPSDPSYAASEEVQQRVLAVLKRLAPSGDAIFTVVSESIHFHDAGANFERVRCPLCNSEVGIEWWQDRMSDDWEDGGFRLDPYETPCCGDLCTLSQFKYEWPQAFGRTSWTVRNAKLGEFDAASHAELEAAAGRPLVMIRQHI
jgi:hypothetical protein